MEVTDRLKQIRAEHLEQRIANDKLDRCRMHLDSKYGYFSERLRSAYIQMIVENEPDYSVVLTFAHNSTTEAHALKTLTECLKHVDRKIYNHNKSGKVTVFPFLERNHNDGIHFHLLMKEPGKKNDLETVLRKKWKKMNGHGYAAFREDWFKPIDELLGAAEYVTKQTYTDHDPLVADCLHY